MSFADVHNFALMQHGGAVVIRVAADRDNNIELRDRQVVYRLGFLRCNIDTGFGHDRDRIRIQAMRFDTCRVGNKLIGFKMSSPAFRHLAATRITCT